MSLTTGHGTGDVPSNVTDRVLLRAGHAVSTGQIVHGWVGPWPPPSVLIRITQRIRLSDPESASKIGDHARVVNPDEQDPGVIDSFRASPAYQVDTYDLFSASQIDHAAAPDEKWFRGAEYVLRPGRLL